MNVFKIRRNILGVSVVILAIIACAVVYLLRPTGFDDMTLYDKVKNKNSVNILICGDSIGEGYDETAWCTILADRFKEKYKLYSVNVTNISLGGNTTFAGYAQINLLNQNDSLSYDLIVFCYGQNDADDNDFQTIYEAMVRAAIKKCPQANIVAVLESSQRTYTNKINEIIEVCDYYDIPYADTIEAFNNSEMDYGALSDDGVHPNIEGKKIYAEVILKTIEDKLLAKKQNLKLVNDPISSDCSLYDNFFYVPLTEMGKGSNYYYYQVDDEFDGIGIDRIVVPGESSLNIAMGEQIYDLSVNWPYDFKQRHIERTVDRVNYTGEIRISGDTAALDSVNGIILFSKKEFAAESFSVDVNGIEQKENAVDTVAYIENSILDRDGYIKTSEEYKNYILRVYRVMPGDFLTISGESIGNIDTFTRYAFFEDKDGQKLVQAGARNTGGWNDEYSVKVQVPDGAYYLIVSGQNGSDQIVENNDDTEISEQINYIGAFSNSIISAEGALLSSDYNATYANYTVYVYDVAGWNTFELYTDARSNENTIMRYAYSSAAEELLLAQKGSLNSYGWNDQVTVRGALDGGKRFLFVTCQNGAVPVVKVGKS